MVDSPLDSIAGHGHDTQLYLRCISESVLSVANISKSASDKIWK